MDRVISDAIERRATLSEDELRRVRLYVSTRPFATKRIAAGGVLAGRRDTAGQVLTRGTLLTSVEHHLLRRVLLDGQWPEGTSAEQYIADLHAAVRHPAAGVWTYRYGRRGAQEDYVGFLAPNDFTAPAENDERFVWVAYSATYGVIRTGFKTSGFAAVFRSVLPELLVKHTG